MDLSALQEPARPREPEMPEGTGLAGKPAQQVVGEQLKTAYARVPSYSVLTLLGAALLGVVLWPVAGRPLLLGWLAFMALVTLGSFLAARAYQRLAEPVSQLGRWRFLLVAGAGAAGVGWGTAGTLVFPAEPGAYHLFGALLLGGMVAGTVPYMATVMSACTAFLLASLLPLTAWLLLQDEPTHALIAALVLLFTAAMWMTVRSANTAINHALRLRLENADRIRELSKINEWAEREGARLQTEIEDRKRSETELEREKGLAQTTLESIGDGVITTDMTGAVTYVNPAAEQLTGWSNADARGLALPRVLKLIDDASGQLISDPVKRCLQEGDSYRLSDQTLLIHRSEKQDFSVEVAISPIHDAQGRSAGTVLILHDVTEIRGIARRMSYQASHDALTGLVNRHEFERRLRRALENARSEARHHAICYLDLDQFKVVNDTCGHIAGDELLRQLAAVLQGGVRESDTLGRLGGDEFAVLLEGCPLERAIKIAEGLRHTVQNFRFAWQDHVFEIGVSVGLVPINADSGSLTEVLSAADAACYVAKDCGRDRIHVYQPDQKTVAQRHGEQQWVSRISAALEEGRVHLYSQQAMPLSAKARTHDYSEILLRLYDENGEPVPNAAFLPAAKRYNMMPTIDRWVIRKFCSMISEHRPWPTNPPGIFAINLSGQSLSDESFLDFVTDQLEQRGVEADDICFEITETAAIANLTRAMRFISILKDMGAHFALDDFGSGLSSFAYLKNLRVDYLKIDGSFIRDTDDDPVDYAMVEIINQIGHVMDIRTIAESVEQQKVLAKLREMGVDYAQGFTIAKPGPLEEQLAGKSQRQVIS
jgi:diguanylate cyclase (GGDEF)-like protein/PAS domain S-box-containing protein